MNQIPTPELLTIAHIAIVNGAKRIELENNECEITAYQMGMPGQIRIDLKRKKGNE